MLMLLWACTPGPRWDTLTPYAAVLARWDHDGSGAIERAEYLRHACSTQ